MRNLIILSLLLISWTCNAQVSRTIPMRCGTHNKKAQDYFNNGIYGLQTNQLKESRKLFMAAVKFDSTFCDAWNNLSVCCRRMGLFAEAFAAGLHLIDIDSTNSDGWINCSYSAWSSGKTELALLMFNDFQRVIPNDPEGYYGKSMVLYSIDSIPEARVNIYKAQKLSNAQHTLIRPEVYLLKGFIEYKSGNKKNAQEIFEYIYPKYKKNAELNYFLGKCILENEHDIKKSQKYLDRAKALGYLTDNDKIQNN